MPTFRTVSVFECTNKDVWQEMWKSIVYTQLTYCFPTPSEYFQSVQFIISEDHTYLEQHINFENEEKYNEWYDIFGEITEELTAEFIEDIEKFSITCKRYFEDVELAKVSWNAYPLSDFKSKFDDSYKGTFFFGAPTTSDST